MADRKYYVICDSGCKFESMTKEQILTAITQAVKEGTVGDCDTGFITTIKTINGKALKFFIGTQAEYEALSKGEKENLFALITNDTTKESLIQALEEMQANLAALNNSLADGSFEVEKARQASKATNKGLSPEEASFVFANTNGFGNENSKENGFWRVWNYGNETDGFFCCLIPSLAGKQSIGAPNRALKTVYAELLEGTAKYAAYASLDTSKGTIEERLTRLGFNQGAFALEGISTENVVVNSIKKIGTKVIANLMILTSSSNAQTLKAYIPEEFRPSHDWKCFVRTSFVQFNELTLNANSSFFEIGFSSAFHMLNFGWDINDAPETFEF